MIKHGVVAAGSEESAAAAAEMFERGGNAMDAAVAAAFATAAGDPSICSLAGGGVLLWRNGESGEVTVCDFFAAAPGLGQRAVDTSATAPPRDFRSVNVDFQSGGHAQPFHIGRGAAAVPGMIRGLCAARDRWGTLPLTTILNPAIDFLERGSVVTEYQARCHATLEPILRASELGRALFYDAEAQRLRPGALFTNTRLANTLKSLGARGYDEFDRSTLRPAILSAFSYEAGGYLTSTDLDAYTPRFERPLVVDYGSTRVYTLGPPSFGGPLVALTLATFRAHCLASTCLGSEERYQLLTAILRAIAEARRASPAIATEKDALQRITNRVASILKDPGPPSACRGSGDGVGNTTHISTIDDDGNVATMTLSHGEGNGYEIPGTGIFMNNLLGEEDLFPEGLLRFTPGERLRTMMAPCILLGGDVESGQGNGHTAMTALGSGGANRIRTVVPQFISWLVDDGLSLQESLQQPRLHYEDGVLSSENFLFVGAQGDTVLAAARRLALGEQRFDAPTLYFGGVHVARRSASGHLEGAGDSRRGGVARVV